MSKSEIIAELAHLGPEDLAEVQAKLDDIAGNVWLDRGELSEGEKRLLEDELAEYEKSPNEGSSWDEVKARIKAKMRP